jgi:NAD-dependent deacetylase
MGSQVEEQIEEVAELIIDSKTLVVFTGAGMSTESGIPDFRSPGGIWERYDPADFTYQKFLSGPEARKKIWERFKLFRMISDVEPNPAHYAVAELYKLGKLNCVITQNVDALHQKAGVPDDDVIELHGTIKWVKCLGCGKLYSTLEIIKRLEEGVEEPLCDDCGGILKSATISFGEPMPVKETQEAEHRSRSCDLMVVVGSSLVVYPAAYMPIYAVESGAKLVIINLGPTPMDRHAAVCINQSAGEVMTRVVERVKAKLA